MFQAARNGLRHRTQGANAAGTTRERHDDANQVEYRAGVLFYVVVLVLAVGVVKVTDGTYLRLAEARLTRGRLLALGPPRRAPPPGSGCPGASWWAAPPLCVCGGDGGGGPARRVGD